MMITYAFGERTMRDIRNVSMLWESTKLSRMGIIIQKTTKPIEMSVFQSLQTEISDGCVKVLNNEKNLQIITDYEYRS